MKFTARGNRGSMLPEMVIVLAVCVAVHSFVVDPLKQRLEETQAKVNTLIAESREAGKLGDDLPRVTQILTQAAAQAQTIHDLSRDATNESALFTAITSLAVLHNVRIDQLDPREPSSRQPQPSQTPGAMIPAPRPGDHVLAYTITATARYADLTAFVDALTDELGYTAVHSLRIEPTYDPAMPTVLATIVTQHYAFDATPLVTAPVDGTPPPSTTP